jgi:hypothetical protein
MEKKIQARAGGAYVGEKGSLHQGSYFEKALVGLLIVELHISVSATGSHFRIRVP